MASSRATTPTRGNAPASAAQQPTNTKAPSNARTLKDRASAAVQKVGKKISLKIRLASKKSAASTNANLLESTVEPVDEGTFEYSAPRNHFVEHATTVYKSPYPTYSTESGENVVNKVSTNNLQLAVPTIVYLIPTPSTAYKSPYEIVGEHVTCASKAPTPSDKFEVGSEYSATATGTATNTSASGSVGKIVESVKFDEDATLPGSAQTEGHGSVREELISVDSVTANSAQAPLDLDFVDAALASHQQSKPATSAEKNGTPDSLNITKTDGEEYTSAISETVEAAKVIDDADANNTGKAVDVVAQQIQTSDSIVGPDTKVQDGHREGEAAVNTNSGQQCMALSAPVSSNQNAVVANQEDQFDDNFIPEDTTYELPPVVNEYVVPLDGLWDVDIKKEFWAGALSYVTRPETHVQLKKRSIADQNNINAQRRKEGAGSKSGSASWGKSIKLKLVKKKAQKEIEENLITKKLPPHVLALVFEKLGPASQRLVGATCRTTYKVYKKHFFQPEIDVSWHMDDFLDNPQVTEAYVEHIMHWVLPPHVRTMPDAYHSNGFHPGLYFPEIFQQLEDTIENKRKDAEKLRVRLIRDAEASTRQAELQAQAQAKADERKAKAKARLEARIANGTAPKPKVKPKAKAKARPKKQSAAAKKTAEYRAHKRALEVAKHVESGEDPEEETLHEEEDNEEQIDVPESAGEENPGLKRKRTDDEPTRQSRKRVKFAETVEEVEFDPLSTTSTENSKKRKRDVEEVTESCRRSKTTTENDPTPLFNEEMDVCEDEEVPPPVVIRELTPDPVPEPDWEDKYEIDPEDDVRTIIKKTMEKQVENKKWHVYVSKKRDSVVTRVKSYIGYLVW